MNEEYDFGQQLGQEEQWRVRVVGADDFKPNPCVKDVRADNGNLVVTWSHEIVDGVCTKCKMAFSIPFCNICGTHHYGISHQWGPDHDR